MWNYFEAEEGRWYYWNLNGAGVYLCREGDVWRMAADSVLLRDIRPEAGGPEGDISPKNPPGCFALGAGRQAALRPYFYEKPYYINFRDKIRLMPEAETRLELALPPVLRLELAGGLELLRFTPFLLSETWSGSDTMSGFLCLSLPVDFGPSALTGESSLIHGELIFRNPTKTILDIDRLILSANSLGIYEKDGHLRCESIVVDTNGSGGELRLTPRPGAPEGYRLITAAQKNGMGDTLIRRSADLLKNIAGI
ncbi:MAG: hypothetical protein LBL19_01950 [Spirochaetaceae bacterium]|jgi:hypothetical protein|nr:hypothetical protein [Spirochaetaceae bacterium]